MNRPSGGIMHGTASTTSVGDYTEADSRSKTIKFPTPFTITPYIVISPASTNSSYKTSIPAAWYYDESTTDFHAKLYAAAKLTWIAVGIWK